jgi:hypothetical protein
MNTDTVLTELAERLRVAEAEPIVSPCGTRLRPAKGRFPTGLRVLAPGIDDCRPRMPAEVIASGLRRDYAGVWCLLRLVQGEGAYALVAEDHLHEYRGAGSQAAARAAAARRFA